MMEAHVLEAQFHAPLEMEKHSIKEEMEEAMNGKKEVQTQPSQHLPLTLLQDI